MQMRSQGWFQDSGQRHMVVGCCLWTPCFSTARLGCTRRGAAQEMLLELVHSRVLGFLGVIPTQHPLSTAPCRVLVLQHRHLLGCPLGEAALLLAKESGCWIQAPECTNANSPPRTSELFAFSVPEGRPHPSRDVQLALVLFLPLFLSCKQRLLGETRQLGLCSCLQNWENRETLV